VSFDEGIIRLVDPKRGTIREVCDAKARIRGVEQLDAARLVCDVADVAGKGLLLLDLETGKAAICFSGAESYSTLGIKPGRGWLMVKVERTEEAETEFHRVDLKTRKAEVIFACKRYVEASEVTDDGVNLIVHTDSDKEEERIRHTVDLATKAVKTEKARRPAESWPQVDGQGSVVLDKHKLFRERDGQRDPFFADPCWVWAEPNRKKAARWLMVNRLVDSNHDGKLAREDGDLVEIWVLDLKTLEMKQLADAKRENIDRDWSDDEAWLVYNRLLVSKDSKSLHGYLVLYEAATGTEKELAPVGKADYVWAKGWAGPGQVFVEHCRTLGKRSAGVQFALEDLRFGKRTVLLEGDFSWEASRLNNFWVLEEYAYDTQIRSLYRWRPPAPAEKTE
jgi:hypothetical protein